MVNPAKLRLLTRKIGLRLEAWLGLKTKPTKNGKPFKDISPLVLKAEFRNIFYVPVEIGFADPELGLTTKLAILC